MGAAVSGVGGGGVFKLEAVVGAVGGAEGEFEILHLLVGTVFVGDGGDHELVGLVLGGGWGFGGVEFCEVLFVGVFRWVLVGGSEGRGRLGVCLLLFGRGFRWDREGEFHVYREREREILCSRSRASNQRVSNRLILSIVDFKVIQV